MESSRIVSKYHVLYRNIEPRISYRYIEHLIVSKCRTSCRNVTSHILSRYHLCRIEMSNIVLKYHIAYRNLESRTPYRNTKTCNIRCPVSYKTRNWFSIQHPLISPHASRQRRKKGSYLPVLVQNEQELLRPSESEDRDETSSPFLHSLRNRAHEPRLSLFSRLVHLRNRVRVGVRVRVQVNIEKKSKVKDSGKCRVRGRVRVRVNVWIVSEAGLGEGLLLKFTVVVLVSGLRGSSRC